MLNDDPVSQLLDSGLPDPSNKRSVADRFKTHRRMRRCFLKFGAPKGKTED
jgi:hypothetical protein